ncbi:MAG: PIG-L deacetylase family protein [Phycisphaerae bacterium]
MISSRPFASLSEDDVVLWNAIDGRKTVQELGSTVPRGAQRLKRLWSLGACEFAEAAFPKGRRRVLVIEPHMDDAVLSVGGLMWRKRHECQFTLLTVAAVSNFTSYYRLDREYFDPEAVTPVRRAESQLIARLLGGDHLMLDKRDAPLRYNAGHWSLTWYRKNRRSLSAYQNRSPSEDEVRSWAEALANSLASVDPDEIWLPLGVGTSVDHQTTRNACLRALQRLPVHLGSTPVYFYQDSPYAYQYPWHTDQIVQAFSAAGGGLDRAGHEIADVMEQKLRLVSIYGSQFKLDYMRPRVEGCAKAASDRENGFAELRFRIRALPDKLDEMSMYSGQQHVEKAKARLRGWYPRHRTASHVRILCPMGVGRWREYMDALLDAFPNATFEVYKSDDSLDETDTLKTARIVVHEVQANAWAWLKRAVRLRFSRPAPTVIFTHAKLERLSAFLRLAYTGCHALPCTTMDHLVLALRALNDRSS